VVRELGRDATRYALAQRLEPRVFAEEEIQLCRRAAASGFTVRVPFPSFGLYHPPGWLVLNRLPCDLTGRAEDSAAVLSYRQLAQRLRPGMGYAWMMVGPHNGIVAEFARYPSARPAAHRVQTASPAGSCVTAAPRCPLQPDAHSQKGSR
jgi:hypothetical protein